MKLASKIGIMFGMTGGHDRGVGEGLGGAAGREI